MPKMIVSEISLTISTALKCFFGAECIQIDSDC